MSFLRLLLLIAFGVTVSSTIIFIAGPPAQSQCGLVASPNSTTANNTSGLKQTFTARDAHNNPVPDASVTLSGSGTNNISSATSGATDANGQSAVSCGSSLAQNENFTVSAENLSYTTAGAFVPGPVSTSYFSITASPTSLVANNNTTASLRVHLADNTNNSIAGQCVSYSALGDAGPFARATTVTDGLGNTNNSLSSQHLGANKVYASPQDVFLSTTVTYTGTTAYCSGNPNYSASTVTGLSSPACLAVGNFNNHGKLDTSLANNSNQINVYLGTGNGTFGTAIISDAGGGCHSAALADLNADGITDIVYANGGQTFSTAFGVGNGSFASPTSYSGILGNIGVRVDDLNNDGFVDVVIAFVLNAGPILVLNIGTGALGPYTSLTATGISYDAAVVDFNGDGIRDIAYSDNGNNTIDIFNWQQQHGFCVTRSIRRGKQS